MNVPASPTLARVVPNGLCSGCGLCAGVSGGAIEMTTVAPGFSQPRQSAAIDARAEGAIDQSCPGSRVADWDIGAPNRHPSWGPWRRTLTGHAIDPDIRHAGSSGGALSALLIHALDSGLVDRVLHIAPCPDLPTRNRLIWSHDAASVVANAGSRYAASSPLAEIDAALSQPGRFAFVGKPCDVSALRRLALVDPRVDAQIPVKLSFFCGGIPSHDGADRIIRAMGLEPNDVRAFRYRGNGWPGLTVAETADGRRGTMRYADSWGAHLSREVQFRCKICPDAVGGVADIACADAWYGGDSGYPSFEEEAGRSLIMTRTAAGDALLNAAIAAGCLDVEPLDIAEVDLMQPAQARRKRVVAARTAACRVMMKPVPQMRELDVARASRDARLGEKLRNFVGTARRIAKGQR